MYICALLDIMSMRNNIDFFMKKQSTKCPHHLNADQWGIKQPILNISLRISYATENKSSYECKIFLHCLKNENLALSSLKLIFQNMITR